VNVLIFHVLRHKICCYKISPGQQLNKETDLKVNFIGVALLFDGFCEVGQMCLAFQCIFSAIECHVF
jgi:hypothetical protein